MQVVCALRVLSLGHALLHKAQTLTGLKLAILHIVTTYRAADTNQAVK